MDKSGKIQIQKQRWQWGISLIVTSLVYTFIFLTRDIIFSTNDDIRIMYALAGYNTGEPYPYHPFINFFLGKIISMMYQILPQIPWYGLFHVACLFVGCVVIGKCLLKNSVRKNNGILFPVVLHLFALFTVLIPVIVSMQFSTTPAVLGIAGVLLVLSLDVKKDTRRDKIFSSALSMIFLLICYMTRSFTWYFVMCFYALAMAYQIILLYPKRKKRMKKWTIFFAIVLVTSVIAALGVKQISLALKAAAEENPEFEEYNDYRTDYQDYGKYVKYKEAPEFYNSIGWSENNFRATRGLLFFDEGFNADTLKEITEKYSSDGEKRDLQDTMFTAKAIFDGYRVAKTAMCVVMLFFMLCIIYTAFNLKRWREGLCALCAAAGYFFIYFVLAYRGRLPLRMFMAVTICASVFLIALFAKTFSWKPTKTILGKLVFAGAVFGMLGIAAYNVRAVYFTNDCTRPQTTTTATKEQVLEMEQYAIEHKDNVYVYDFSVGTVQREPFVVYPKEKPTNCIISGGSYTFSTIYYKQLRANNLESLYWKDFLRENIYFVSANERYVELMQDNISEEVGKTVEVRMIKEFAADGAKVYQFYTSDK